MTVPTAARGVTVADVLQLAVADSVARLLSHTDGVRRGRDPEAVHQARVATRRLRSDLRTFGRFVDTAWAGELRGELRWLGGDLGAVRDVEVLHGHLLAHAARVPDAHEAVARLGPRLAVARAEARRVLVTSLASPRYAALAGALERAATAPPCTPDAGVHAAAALAPVVRGAWRRLRREVGALGVDPSDEALHAVRIRAKRARYAAEAVTPVFGGPARRFARRLAEVQDVLGRHQDAVVARAWLAKAASESSPSDAYLLGMVAREESRVAGECRRAFPAAWDAVRRPRLRSWM